MLDRQRTKNCFAQLRFSSPHQPRQPDDLPCIDPQADLPDLLPARSQVANLQKRPPDGHLGLGIGLRKSMAQHPLHHLQRGKPCRWLAGDHLPVPQDRQLLTNFKDLWQPVRNEHNPYPMVGRQLLDQTKEFPCLCNRKRGSRFVQDQKLRLLTECTRDQNHLLLGQTQFLRQQTRLQLHPHPLQHRLGRTVQLCPVDPLTPPHFVDHHIQHDVLRHRKRGHQRSVDFLKYNLYPLRLGRTRGVNVYLLAVHPNAACVVAVRTRQNFHQRRFARPVGTDQRLNSAGVDGEIDPLQRLHARKFDGDVFHLQDMVGLGCDDAPPQNKTLDRQRFRKRPPPPAPKQVADNPGAMRRQKKRTRQRPILSSSLRPLLPLKSQCPLPYGVHPASCSIQGSRNAFDSPHPSTTSFKFSMLVSGFS